ncbi:L,D-transpeptidase [Streptomyces sp. NPDC005046]
MMIRRRVCQGIAVLLTVVAAVPVGSATAAPPPPGPVGESVLRAVKGPYPPWQGGALDLAAPAEDMPSAGEDGRQPRGTSEGDDAPIAYVPFGDGAAGPEAACSKRTGPYQRQVERWLRLTVDGRQSAADCLVIRDFQAKQGIRPASGFAGPLTWARMRLLSARDDPNHAGACPVRSYRVACVDLTRQLTWVQQRGKILYGPVPMRSGGVRHPTRTGWFRIYWKHRNHWSTLYNTPMPYAQFFSRGQAFHAVRGSIRTTGGSMGCVNLRPADARALWNVLRTRDRVYVWGRRSGS